MEKELNSIKILSEKIQAKAFSAGEGFLCENNHKSRVYRHINSDQRVLIFRSKYDIIKISLLMKGKDG
ncbi:MAG: hypothetical protein IJ391_06945 [Clostridia bacterium]|nr:hypothetical protein [Clostridia bacterium]